MNNPNNTEAELSTHAQQSFIFCSSERTDLTLLIDLVESELKKMGIPAKVVLWGVSTKRKEGFIVVEAEKAIPAEFRDRLAQEISVYDFVVCDAPRVLTEDEQDLLPIGYEQEKNPLPPPIMPEGYKLQSEPRPLYTSRDSYWIVWAWTGEAGVGLLLYDESGKVIAFLTTEEAITLLYTLLERATELLIRCEQKYLRQHAPGVAFLRMHLWALQIEIMRSAEEYRRARRSQGEQGE